MLQREEAHINKKRLLFLLLLLLLLLRRWPFSYSADKVLFFQSRPQDAHFSELRGLLIFVCAKVESGWCGGVLMVMMMAVRGARGPVAVVWGPLDGSSYFYNADISVGND